MNKDKVFKILSLMGVIFVFYMGWQFVQATNNRGAVIENPVVVPDNFSRQFGGVHIKNRVEAMPKATFMSPEGKRKNWQMYDGEYLLVNFWATWCAPCVLELPSLGKLEQKYADKGLKVIAISIDAMKKQSDLKEFLYNRGIGEFAAYFDDAGEVQKNIYMRGIPSSYLLSPKGEILVLFEGDANWASQSAYQFFDSILTPKIP